MKVYLAGPMRGYPRYNFDSFEHAAGVLRHWAIQVISPAEHDLEQGFDPNLTLEEQDFDLGAALLWDLTQIATEVEAVVVLPGWERSQGTAAEMALARAVGKPVYEFCEYLDRDEFDLLSIDADDQQALVDNPRSFGFKVQPDPWPDGGQEVAETLQEQINKIMRRYPMHTAAQTGEVRVTDPNTGGQKGSKLARFDLIPPDALWQLAEHYGRGAQKYDDNNWRRGYAWGLSYAAMMRHAWAFWNGENIDAETGSSHLVAVAWHAITLLTFQTEQLGTDDRNKAAS